MHRTPVDLVEPKDADTERPTPSPIERTGLWAALAGILTLDLAALDDILTGSDPSLLTEIVVLLASVPVIVAIVERVRSSRR